MISQILRYFTKRTEVTVPKAENPLLIEGKTCLEWYQLGKRQEAGGALGAALYSYEKAVELSFDKGEFNGDVLRVAWHFVHIPKYKEMFDAK